MRVSTWMIVGAACLVAGALLLRRLLPLALALVAVGVFLMILPKGGSASR